MEKSKKFWKKEIILKIQAVYNWQTTIATKIDFGTDTKVDNAIC